MTDEKLEICSECKDILTQYEVASNMGFNIDEQSYICNDCWVENIER